jgi:molecular chaperone Hsp33
MSDSRFGGSLGEGRPADDLVLPFRTVRSGVIGRLVRLGPVVDGILGRHAYPESVSRVLGEAVALTTLLGSSLKFDSGPGGRLILQTKSDGPLGLLVVDFEEPGRVRAYASFDKERIEKGAIAGGRLLGTGHLVMTIDPGGSLDRYQGIVPLANDTLATAAHTYFRQSEQIPTYLRLAVARQYTAPAARGGGHGAWHWRAGGLLIQYMPRIEEGAESDSDDDRRLLIGEDDDRWVGTRMLASTVEDHELLDPTLSPEALLYRLFAEEGVRAHPAIPLLERCHCSRDRVGTLLSSFGTGDLEDMREADGAITVTCEFCNAKYRFETDEIAGTRAS